MATERKTLPFRGATFWGLIISVAGLVALGIALRGQLVPRDRQGGAFVIWLISVGILLVSLFRGFLDASRLQKEWVALGAMSDDPDSVIARSPATTVADRILSVRRVISERRAEREFRQSNRAIAAAQISDIGSYTRFAGSLLLVMAVLGTFAGMKDALTPLVNAITTASESLSTMEGATGSTEIQSALQLVANAFGANFLALLGSLIAGALSFCATNERRAFLTQLEVQSERTLYRQLPVDADATEMQRAVSELQKSVSEIANVAYSVERLGTGITELRGTLQDTMEEMQSAFSTSIQQHSVRSQQEMKAAIGEIVATLGTTGKALDVTALSYQGLVKGLEERDLGVRALAETLSRHSELLGSATAQVSQTSAAAAATVDKATQMLQRVVTVSETAIPAFTRSADNIVIAVGSTADSVAAQTELLKTFESKQGRVTDAISSLGDRVDRTAIAQLAALTELQAQAVAVRETLSSAVGTVSSNVDRIAAEQLTALRTIQDKASAAHTVIASGFERVSDRIDRYTIERTASDRELGESLSRTIEEASATASTEQRAVNSSVGQLAALQREHNASIQQQISSAIDASNSAQQQLRQLIETRLAGNRDAVLKSVLEATATLAGAVNQSRDAITNAVMTTGQTSLLAADQSAKQSQALLAALRERAAENGGSAR